MIIMTVLSVRLDAELEERIKILMKKRKIFDKSAYVRQLLDRSTKEDFLDFLCSEVKERHMTAWKAAEMDQISLRAMLSELSERGISIYDERALEEDIEFVWNH